MDALFEAETWIALFTLAGLEIVLGVDNIVFLSIMAAKLPKDQQRRARLLGLGGAMATRILLLLSLTWIMKLTRPLFAVFAQEFSGRDLILIAGGAFLIAKSTFEIHDEIEGGGPEDDAESLARRAASFTAIVLQIAVIDIVFSLDSVITAVGMTQNLPVMVAAIVIAVVVMMFASGTVSAIVERHPTIKILALSFLNLIGMALVAEGFDFHVPKGYIYFAMAFSVVVEAINLRVRKPVPRPSHPESQKPE
jgi:predicted tellurium resistance membrane protein TerC